MPPEQQCQARCAQKDVVLLACGQGGAGDGSGDGLKLGGHCGVRGLKLGAHGTTGGVIPGTWCGATNPGAGDGSWDVDPHVGHRTKRRMSILYGTRSGSKPTTGGSQGWFSGFRCPVG